MLITYQTLICQLMAAGGGRDALHQERTKTVLFDTDQEAPLHP
jgi:hypothetical protein